MSTLAQMTDEVLMGLSSYGLVQPRFAQLSSGITAVDTTVTLSSTTGFEVGHTAEIEDELVYVTDVNAAGPTITVVRGYLSTTAATHATGVFAQCNPLWPRWMVQRAVNDAIVKSYPTLFVPDVLSLSGTMLTNAYTVPATVQTVRAVKIEDLNGSGELFNYCEFRYDFNRHELNLHVQTFEDQDIEVEYVKRPVEIASGEELVISGLAESARPYIVAKATADLVSRMDSHRLQVNFASAADMAANRPSGSANALARQLLAIAEVELQAERKRLVQQYPPVIVKSKGRF